MHRYWPRTFPLQNSALKADRADRYSSKKTSLKTVVEKKGTRLQKYESIAAHTLMEMNSLKATKVNFLKVFVYISL